jgi:hypothetical protein
MKKLTSAFNFKTMQPFMKFVGDEYFGLKGFAS